MKHKQVRQLWAKAMPNTLPPSDRWLKRWARSNSDSALKAAIRKTANTDKKGMSLAAIHKYCGWLLGEMRGGEDQVRKMAGFQRRKTVKPVPEVCALRPLPSPLTGSWQAFFAKPGSQPEERLEEACWHYALPLESRE